MKFGRILSILLLFLPIGLWAQEEEDPPPLVDEVAVNVVNVDVTVTDRQGNPVSGLGPDDFELLEDGEAKDITNFYVIENRKVKAAGSEEWQPTIQTPFRQRVIILIDNNSVPLLRRNSAIESLREFMNSKFDDSFEVSIVAVGDEVRILQPLTIDRFEIQDALDTAQAMPVRSDRFAADREALDDPSRAQLASMRREQAAARGVAADETSDLSGPLTMASRFNAIRNLNAVQLTSAAMLQTFRAYSHLEGRKILLMVTGGFELRPELAMLSMAGQEGGSDFGAANVPRQDSQLYQLFQQLRQTIDSTARAANEAGFRIYTLKATGTEVQTPSNDVTNRGRASIESLASFSGPVEIDDTDSAALQLSGSTGGLHLTSNTFLDQLERVDRDSSVYYSLGYNPGHYGDGDYHKIKVRLKGDRDGLVVRAREGYVDLTEDDRLAQHLASPLVFEKDAGSLPVEIDVTPDAGSAIRATATLSMSELSFIEQGALSKGQVLLLWTLYDAQGTPQNQLRRLKQVEFPANLTDEALTRSFSYTMNLQVKEAGDYTVGVTLVDKLSGEIGTAFGNVRI